MKLRLICDYKNDYGDVFDSVEKVIVGRDKSKRYLEISFNGGKEKEFVYLKDIRLAYLFDVDTMHEFFRIEN